MTDVQVIIATRDRPQMLEVALHSILASAAMVPERVRVLVVDDASEQVNAEWNEFTCETVRVDYVRNPINLGVGASLARGYNETESEFSVFWGDDDFMLPRFMQLHLTAIREGHDVAYSNYFMANHDLKPGREIRLPLVSYRDLMRGQCNATDQALIRRSRAVPWRPERERAMLMTFWLAMTHAGRDIALIREATWLYRRHPDQLSHTKPNEHDQSLRDAAIADYLVPA